MLRQLEGLGGKSSILDGQPIDASESDSLLAMPDHWSASPFKEGVEWRGLLVEDGLETVKEAELHLGDKVDSMFRQVGGVPIARQLSIDMQSIFGWS